MGRAFQPTIDKGPQDEGFEHRRSLPGSMGPYTLLRGGPTLRRNRDGIDAHVQEYGRERCADRILDFSCYAPLDAETCLGTPAGDVQDEKALRRGNAVPRRDLLWTPGTDAAAGWFFQV